MEILRATAYFQIVINIPYLYYFVYIKKRVFQSRQPEQGIYN